MSYKIERNTEYDFIGQSYGEQCFPNLHRYPATMIPQLGSRILDELDIKTGSMLDPYCGSGSSFASGLSCGIKCFTGFDLNPLAALITKVRFTKIDLEALKNTVKTLRKGVDSLFLQDKNIAIKESFVNFEYWFSEKVALDLELLKNCIESISDKVIKNFLMLSLSLTMRDCSNARNSEFKLYRMKKEDLLLFNPNVIDVFFSRLQKSIELYEQHYLEALDGINLSIHTKPFEQSKKQYHVVLTSPPYGDSRTTVAYGQFSLFTNQWLLGICNARGIDKTLMGGSKNVVCTNSLINK